MKALTAAALALVLGGCVRTHCDEPQLMPESERAARAEIAAKRRMAERVAAGELEEKSPCNPAPKPEASSGARIELVGAHSYVVWRHSTDLWGTLSQPDAVAHDPDCAKCQPHPTYHIVDGVTTGSTMLLVATAPAEASK